MTHERNENISLDMQIAIIRNNIAMNISKFPIDIVKTVIDDELQIYYENEAGYWEKTTYDENYNIIEYMDSTMVKEDNNEPHYSNDNKELNVFLIQPRNAKEEKEIDAFNDQEFINMATKQSLVYTIEEFQELCNQDMIDIKDKLIRFIKI